MRYLFGLSLALNLLLLSTIVGARIDPRPAEAGRPIAMTWSGATDDLDSLLESLERGGATEHEIRAVSFAWLEAAAARDHAVPRQKYWSRTYAPGKDEMQSRMARESAVRDELLRRFGPDAAAEPLFAGAFRPLGPAYDFLSPAAQLALQDLWLESLETPSVPVSLVPGCRSVPGDGTAVARPSPDGVLSASELLEYRLRFSGSASQLRHAFDAVDEARFREAFIALDRVAQASSPRAQIDARSRLRRIVGDDAFDRLWSLRDPLFGRLERFLRSRGHNQNLIERAYAIVNRAQEELLAIAARRAGDRGLGEIRRVKDAESARLASLLGDETARLLGIQINRFVFEMHAEPAEDC